MYVSYIIMLYGNPQRIVLWKAIPVILIILPTDDLHASVTESILSIFSHMSLYVC